MSYEFTGQPIYNGREIAFDIDALMSLLPSSEPENEYQALMEAAPFDEIPVSKNRVNELREIVRDCVDMLLEQDKFIIHAIGYEQISYEELGKRLGISATHAWRLKQIAYKHLAEIIAVDGRVIRILDARSNNE